MPDNNFTDGTLDNQLYDILVGLSEAGTYEPPSRDCFNDLTLDNQLYQILLAVGDISGGGGGGILSINGDVTPDQVISGTSPIGVTTAAGTTTISSTQSGAATDGYLSSTDWNTFNNKVGSVSATAPLTSSGGTTPDISTSMNTNRLIGRTTAGTGVMEEISTAGTLTLSAGTLTGTGVGGSVGAVDNAVLRADVGTGIVQNSSIIIDDETTTTQNNVAIRNNDSQTNSALVLTPKGTGAFILGPKPDGTATGGNARGTNAVDLQLARNAATQVASGVNGICIGERNSATAAEQTSIAIGFNNTAGSSATVAIGSGNTATGSYGATAIGYQNSATLTGIAIGRDNTSSSTQAVSLGSQNTSSSTYAGAFGRRSVADRYGMQAHAADRFAANGDAQRARFVMRNKTTTNAAVELFLDGSATRLTIPGGKVLGLTINITGIKSDGSAVAHYLRQYCLKHVSATTSEVYAPVTIGTDNPAGTSIALSADDPNNALKVEVTGIAGETWRWVAAVDAVEIAFGL
jgi:hypothetical protein